MQFIKKSKYRNVTFHTTNTIAIEIINVAILCSGMASFLNRTNLEVSRNADCPVPPQESFLILGRYNWLRKDDFKAVKLPIVEMFEECSSLSLGPGMLKI